MTWRDKLRKGSFRGAAFEIDAHDLDTGRRGQIHQYPGRDVSYFEDLGRKAREFTIEVFVVGDDYAAARDALVQECERPGSGTLVHPFLGTFEVYATGCRLRESTREGRMARLSLTFMEAGARRFPTAASDTSATARLSAANLVTAATEGFADDYVTEGQPGFVTDSTKTAASEFMAVIAGVKRTAAVVSEIDSVTSNLSTLVRDPAGLASSVSSLVRILSDAAGELDPVRVGLKYITGPNAAADYMRTVSAFTTDHLTGIIPLTTDTRRREAGNLAAFGGMVRRVAFAEEGRQLSLSTFDSYQGAIARLGDFSERMDSEILSAGTAGAVFDALSDLRASVTRDMRARAGGLPTIVSRTVSEATPALVLAYELYQDATRDSEIIARNGIQHPSWVNPDSPLETLNK